jgi:hypothetical protein
MKEKTFYIIDLIVFVLAIVLIMIGRDKEKKSNSDKISNETLIGRILLGIGLIVYIYVMIKGKKIFS